MKSIYKVKPIILFIALCFTLQPESIIAVERANNLYSFGIGARAIGLNNAYTAISNDYTAPFWNPAAMDFFSTIKIGGMRSNMSLNRAMSYFALVFPTNKYGAFALAWAGFGVGGIEVRSSNTEQPDNHFNYNENTFSFCYAYRILSYLSFGSNFKVYDYRAYETKAYGLGMDLAVLFIPSNKFRLGFVAHDIDSYLRWSSAATEKFLETYRLGLSFDPLSNISISCDYHQNRNNKAKFSLATEVLTLRSLKLRCGIAQQRFTFGMGFTVPVKGIYLNFNYAMATDQFNQGVSDVFDVSVVF
jgi:opacity protein-like surface antigen